MSEIAKLKGYDIRDKKLADSSSQSVVNTNDAVRMKTTDGKEVFIEKSSFMQAIGEAFAASDPKTFTKLLGINGTSPMGIGPSDLASVLGVILGHTNQSYNDFTTLTTEGTYAANGDLCRVSRSGNYIVQDLYLLAYTNGTPWARMTRGSVNGGASWSPWVYYFVIQN